MALFNLPEKRRPGFKLALFACALAIVVLGLGAFTRLANAGLGCPDWPGCYGHALWPNEHHEIARANEAFPEAPVELDKTWPEMVHRYFAGSLIITTLALIAIAFKHRQKPAQPIKLPIAIFLLILLQAAFGMWTVTLKLWPQVVTSHLLGGFTMLSLLWLLMLRLNNEQWRLPDRDLARIGKLRGWAVLGLLIVIVQISLGGWTTSNYAAVACPDFPTCQAQWLPAMDFAHGFNIFQHIGPNYLGGTMQNEGRVAIHVMHRIGAIVTGVYLLWLGWRLLATGLAAPRQVALAVMAIVVLQIALGISNIVFHFPLTVAVAHNLTGAVLLLALVTLNHRVFTAQPL
jgi:cytochrome c oxidase assembly protein subunit 15